MKRMLLATIFSLAVGNLAHAHSAAPYAGAIIEAGPSFGSDITTILSGSMIFGPLNGSVDYIGFADFAADQAVRGYAGVGLGPLVQVQVGMGTGGLSGRIKSTVSLRQIFRDEYDRTFFPEFEGEPQWFSRGPTLSVFVEYDHQQEFTAGLLVGVLAW